MIVVCDLDGTISDHSHRFHYVQSKPKNWPAYYAGIPDDPPIAGAQRMLPKLSVQGKAWLMFLTGRPERTRTVTEDWIAKHFPNVPQPMKGIRDITFVHGHSSLLMRTDDDHRPAVTYKTGIASYLAAYSNLLPIIFIDDDSRNEELLSQYGIYLRAPDCWDLMK
jgi:hypothetical protein